MLEANDLEPDQRTIAHLKLVFPIFAFIGDRFVVRDASEQHTIAGGVVLAIIVAVKLVPIAVLLLALLGLAAVIKIWDRLRRLPTPV